MPDFARRSRAPEMMDDFSIDDVRLTRALDNLRAVNRFLGGYATVREGLRPFLQRQDGAPLHVLDVGTGLADTPAYLAKWAAGNGADLRVTGLDANPATAAYARDWLDETLPSAVRGRVKLTVGDALELPFEDGTFDVVTASLFLHHFHGTDAVRLLAEINRVARHGIVVSDLHRHPLGYYAIQTLGRVLPVSPMFRHDAPLSVLRGFQRDELYRLAASAGLRDVQVQWRWAFRWLLTAEVGGGA